MIILGWNDPECFDAITSKALEYNWHLELRAYYTGSVPERWDGDGIIYSKGIRPKLDDFVMKYSKHCPVVALNSNLPKGLNIPVVSPDNYAAGSLAAKHLISRGYKNFSYYSPSKGAVSDLRQAGFKDTIQQAGFSFHPLKSKRTNAANPSWSTQQPYLTKQLDQLPPQTGILALDDLTASDLIEIALESGKKIPDDFAVIGLGNDRAVCECAQTPITSINLRSEEVSNQAAALLNQLMIKRSSIATSSNIPVGELVARESSDATVVHDPRLKQVIHFIKTNIRQPISLEQAADAAGISHRTLYNLFRQELGNTPADYLREERTLIAARLLKENPELTIREAARLAGFSCTRTLSRNLDLSGRS
ncbi:substrate-binding domain-containing protein [Verrucomicrobiaceae bacterium N1E253]|uniref:Substrate-binding domain-containing protein n=2 Tax=Oceaniferula marina TaxID=2748318 RepID=A0A851GQV2_9BACT|nr:substrate-binding domain-containing protein [Oceaniferula marina]